MWAYPPGGSIRSGSGSGVPNMFGGTGLSMATSSIGFALVNCPGTPPVRSKNLIGFQHVGAGFRDAVASGRVRIVTTRYTGLIIT
jgi:hypothetical protein